MSNEHHNNTSHESLTKSEQLIKDTPVRIELDATKPYDESVAFNVFTGNTSALESSDQDDPRLFSIVDLRNAPKDSDGAVRYNGQRLSSELQYLIVQPSSLDWKENKGYKGLRAGEVVDMGRTQPRLKDRFAFPDEMSRNHFTIAVDEEGALLLQDNGSTNGTAYSMEGKSSETPEENGAEREPTRNEVLFAFPTSKGKDRFGNDLDRRLKVTEESLADSETALRYSDEDIRTFLTMARKDNPDISSASELLRANDEVRTKLGEFLLEKLEGLSYLPSRFNQSNQRKNANHVGYESQLTSREYAALLAISMLDGTYKKPTSDPIEVEYGDAIRGQHRYGAMMVLGIQSSELARRQIKKLK